MRLRMQQHAAPAAGLHSASTLHCTANNRCDWAFSSTPAGLHSSRAEAYFGLAESEFSKISTSEQERSRYLKPLSNPVGPV